MNVPFTIRRTAPRAVLALLASCLIPSIPATAMTLAEAYALKGDGKVAAELKLAASGAPMGTLTVSALAQPGQAEKLLADLNALGLAHGAVAGRLVTGRLPWPAVSKLDQLAGLHSIRPSHALFHAADPGAGRQGAIVSQGDKEMHAADARIRFGVDGTGVKVGVLSNSYNCQTDNDLANAAASIQSGDIPPNVEILKDWQLTLVGASKGSPGICAFSVYQFLHDTADEGRAMMGVIHDLAPGASLAFHTSANGAAGMADGIRALADAGATVIVDDTTYLDEPVYQEGGVIADAVKDVVARGVSYVAAAGNFGRKTYEAPFQSSGITQTIQGRTVELHDFDPGPGTITCQQVAVFSFYPVALALHWDQPYASIGGGPGATTDLDFFLMDKNCQQMVPPRSGVQAMSGLGATNNVGGDSVETIFYQGTAPDTTITPSNPNDFQTFGIAVGHVSGPVPTRVKLTYAAAVTPSPSAEMNVEFAARNFGLTKTYPPIPYTQDGPTLFGHANLAEVVTVGAVGARVQRTPPPNFDQMVDTGTNTSEKYSSLGGTEILFDGRGQPLAQPLHRKKPDIAGEDGVDSFYDIRAAPAHIGAGFFGTSASAAHVAGLVALAKQAAPWATPAQIGDALRATANDLNDTLSPTPTPGFDFATGYGLADGENLIAKLLAQPLAERAGLLGGGDASPCAASTVTLRPGARYRGTKRNDIARGAEGNEIMKGMRGNDTLCGEAGNDRLEGGPGNDVLEGGPGNDVLVGGPGADVFQFSGSSSSGADRIVDLGRGDMIQFGGLKDANGDGRVDAGDLAVRNAPGGAVITALHPPAGQERTERIVVRGRKAVQVIRALRFVN